MSTIQNLNNGETGLSHRNKLNTNFSNLNTDKVETSVTVNGHDLSSNVTLTTDDVAEGSTNKYDEVVAILAGAGIQVTGTYPNFTVTNSSPDQVVALTAGTNITITGTYPNFTINSTGGGSGQVDSVVGGTNISVDSTDPTAPIVSLSLGADENFVTDAEKVVIGNTSGTNTGDNATNSQYSGLATSKQDTLVSGTNIKTINGQSVLGAGDIEITSGVPTTRTITINGTSYDLSADRSWTISAGGPSIVAEFATSGTAYAGVVFEKSGRAFTVTSLLISLVTLPVGGNFEVNVKKNGTTILSGNLVITTTESASNSLYVVQTGDIGKATVSTTSFASKDRLTIEVVAGSGNTFLGAGVNIQVIGTIS